MSRSARDWEEGGWGGDGGTAALTKWPDVVVGDGPINSIARPCIAALPAHIYPVGGAASCKMLIVSQHVKTPLRLPDVRVPGASGV